MKKFRVLFSRKTYYTIDLMAEEDFEAINLVENEKVNFCFAVQVDKPKFRNEPEVIGVEHVPFKDGE